MNITTIKGYGFYVDQVRKNLDKHALGEMIAKSSTADDVLDAICEKLSEPMPTDDAAKAAYIISKVEGSENLDNLFEFFETSCNCYGSLGVVLAELLKSQTLISFRCVDVDEDIGSSAVMLEYGAPWEYNNVEVSLTKETMDTKIHSFLAALGCGEVMPDVVFVDLPG